MSPLDISSRGGRHYKGGKAEVTAGRPGGSWFCPTCGVENFGPQENGCLQEHQHEAILAGKPPDPEAVPDSPLDHMTGGGPSPQQVAAKAMIDLAKANARARLEQERGAGRIPYSTGTTSMLALSDAPSPAQLRLSILPNLFRQWLLDHPGVLEPAEALEEIERLCQMATVSVGDLVGQLGLAESGWEVYGNLGGERVKVLGAEIVGEIVTLQLERS